MDTDGTTLRGRPDRTFDIILEFLVTPCHISSLYGQSWTMADRRLKFALSEGQNEQGRNAM